MHEQDRAILAYAKQALGDPRLRHDLQFDEDSPAQPACLRAHLRRGVHGNQPAPLLCDGARVHRLITLGYLHQQGPWLMLTMAGAALLAEP